MCIWAQVIHFQLKGTRFYNSFRPTCRRLWAPYLLHLNVTAFTVNVVRLFPDVYSRFPCYPSPTFLPLRLCLSVCLWLCVCVRLRPGDHPSAPLHSLLLQHAGRVRRGLVGGLLQQAVAGLHPTDKACKCARLNLIANVHPPLYAFLSLCLDS